jgi:hypothetical protein
MLLFYLSTINNLSGEGPMWNLLIDYKSNACANNWWVTLLYLVNYYKPVETTVRNLYSGFTLLLIYSYFIVYNTGVVFNGGHATGTSCPNRDPANFEMAKNWHRSHECPDFGLNGSCFRVHLRPQLPLDANFYNSVSTLSIFD